MMTTDNPNTAATVTTTDTSRWLQGFSSPSALFMCNYFAYVEGLTLNIAPPNVGLRKSTWAAKGGGTFAHHQRLTKVDIDAIPLRSIKAAAAPYPSSGS